MSFSEILKEARALKKEYQAYEDIVINTSHTNHGLIEESLFNMQRIYPRLLNYYDQIMVIMDKNLTNHSESYDKVKLGHEVGAILDRYSARYLERGERLAQAMIRHGYRGNELCQAFLALKRLGYKLNDLEEDAIASLLEEKKIRNFNDKFAACIYINRQLNQLSFE